MVKASTNAPHHWQVDNICLSCHWLALYINIQRARRLARPHKQTKDNDGLTFQTPAADICTASAEERKSTNIPAPWERSKKCKPFLMTLFIFRFFLLSSAGSHFPGSGWRLFGTPGSEQETAGERGVEGGHGAQSRPGGAGLTAAFYSDRHPAHWSLLL